MHSRCRRCPRFVGRRRRLRIASDGSGLGPEVPDLRIESRSNSAEFVRTEPFFPFRYPVGIANPYFESLVPPRLESAADPDSYMCLSICHGPTATGAEDWIASHYAWDFGGEYEVGHDRSQDTFYVGQHEGRGPDPPTDIRRYLRQGRLHERAMSWRRSTGFSPHQPARSIPALFQLPARNGRLPLAHRSQVYLPDVRSTDSQQAHARDVRGRTSVMRGVMRFRKNND